MCTSRFPSLCKQQAVDLLHNEYVGILVKNAFSSECFPDSSLHFLAHHFNGLASVYPRHAQK